MLKRGDYSAEPLPQKPAEMDFARLGVALLNARREKSLKLAECAARLCLSTRQIDSLERADTSPFPSIKTYSWCARRYASLLGLDAREFEHNHQSESPAHQETAEIPYIRPPTLTRPASSKLGKIGAAFAFVLISAGLLKLYTSNADDNTPADDRVTRIEHESVASPASTGSNAQIDTTPQTIHTIDGLDASIAGNHFFLVAQGDVIIRRRSAHQNGSETTLLFPGGVTQRIPVSETELILIESTGKVEVYFQKRKLPAEVINSRQWIKFKKMI